uniref:acetyl-CoA carboxylase carboxyltransferase beta subunit n=1 Tax=Paepalanthus alpinus TaxID=1858743 RepID=UPI001F1333FE|nr:acetyl-CoA carboxylase carboxyltransferase beta subunit [Paepalanthus alpinus]ULQ67288.1 acetyl-CoA carboxylase carboxyltransferase beta subunit [Paepalanthus alpinus]
MEKEWFNPMLSNNKFKNPFSLSKSKESLRALGHPDESKEPILNDREGNWSDSISYLFHNVDSLLNIRDIWKFLSDDTFLVRDKDGDYYSVYFDIEKNRFAIDKPSSLISQLKCFFSIFLNRGSMRKNKNYSTYMYDTESSWNNHIHSCIDNYLRFEIGITNNLSSGNDSDPYIYNLIWNSFLCTEFLYTETINDSESSRIRTSSNGNDLDINKKYRHLWVQCENCYGLNYKKWFMSKMNICEQCGYYLKMSSSDRIEFLIDPGTWDPLDEDMVSMDPIEFHSEEEPYRDRIDSYQRKTGLTEAIQTGLGQLNGIPLAIGVMDFQFMGGSMGSVVGEKITRLIEYATHRSLPLIIVCASGGARMQEGSLSLIQMAKISSALHNYQSITKLFYVSILTSPTTGGVTASFGMLGDVIVTEPNAYIAFAGKRVIEQTLNKTVPDGLQAAEHLFHKGLFDLIIPRNLLKGALSELFQLHGFLPLNQDFKRV